MESNKSEAEHQRCSLVWTQFNIKTLGAYHDLYLLLNVLLLLCCYVKI